MKVIEFDNSDITHPYFKNKSKCFVLNDVFIRKEGDWLCLYHNKKRLNGFVNRNVNNGDTLHWYGSDEPGLYYGEDQPSLTVDEEIDSLFLLYDDYEWQYGHFVMDCMPKMWYWIKLLETDDTIKICLNNNIVSPCYVSDLSKKVDYPTSFSSEYLELYLARYNLILKNHIKFLNKNTTYFIKKLVLPIPFQSVDTSVYPNRFWEMYDIIGRDIDKSNEYNNIYVSRRDVNNKNWMHYRVLLNEEEIIDKLQKIDFKEIKLLEHSVENKIKIFKSANKIIQTVGSNCYNLVFIRENTKCGIVYHPQYACWSEHLKYMIAHKKSKYFEYKNDCEIIENYRDYYPENYNELKKKIDAPWIFKNVKKLIEDFI
jgi:hypothetical protein